MSQTELVTVGLSEQTNEKLDWLREHEYFHEKMDGYRFAVALALTHRVIPKELQKRETLFNVGSLDPDQALKQSVEALMAHQLKETSVYRMMERLAEWGITELYEQAQSGKIDFASILINVQQANVQT